MLIDWSYELSDFVDADGEAIEYDSYMVPDSDIADGALRLLEVDNRVVLPVDTHVRFVVTGADVIHDFAVPSLGLKIDATPGCLVSLVFNVPIAIRLVTLMAAALLLDQFNDQYNIALSAFK